MQLVQFGDLKELHFRCHPVWVQSHVIDYDEPWHEDTDEETFRPWTGKSPVDPSEALFLIRATFTLACSHSYMGFITPQVRESENSRADLSDIQPTIFLPSGQVATFWWGSVPEQLGPHKEQVYKALGRKPEQIFPIEFYVDPTLATGICKGRIDGFCWRREDATLIVER